MVEVMFGEDVCDVGAVGIEVLRREGAVGGRVVGDAAGADFVSDEVEEVDVLTFVW